MPVNKGDEEMVKQLNPMVGKIYQSNNCGKFKVVEYNSSTSVVVEFLDTGYRTTAQKTSILLGQVRDRLVPSLYGVGVIGDTPTKENGKFTKLYTAWKGMLERCYTEKSLAKCPTYLGCSVSDNFKNFTFFKEWAEKQVGSDKDGWNLDKDILVRGNKIYSEDTCCFVPQEVNKIFTNMKNTNSGLVGVNKRPTGKYYATVKHSGKIHYLGSYATEVEAFQAYKQAKEKFVKDTAMEYIDIIDLRVYNALMNYQVEITN